MKTRTDWTKYLFRLGSVSKFPDFVLNKMKGDYLTPSAPKCAKHFDNVFRDGNTPTTYAYEYISIPGLANACSIDNTFRNCTGSGDEWDGVSFGGPNLVSMDNTFCDYKNALKFVYCNGNNLVLTNTFRNVPGPFTVGVSEAANMSHAFENSGANSFDNNVFPTDVVDLNYAFANTPISADNITIPESVKYAEYAFANTATVSPKFADGCDIVSAKGMFMGSNVNSVSFGTNPCKIQDVSYIFANCKNITMAIIPMPNNVFAMNGAFYNSTVRKINMYDVSMLDDMAYAFYNCNNLTNLNMPLQDSFVTNMAYTFDNAKSLPLSGIVVSKSVMNMNHTFANCRLFTGEPACPNNVLDMSYSYYNCANLTGNPVCGPNVVDMSFAYYNCRKIIGNPVCGPNVTDMSYTYNSCINLTGSPVCGNMVRGMSDTYNNCTNLTGSPVCGPNVSYMSGTYRTCVNLTGSPVCGPKVMSMSRTYENCYNLTGTPVCGELVTDMRNTYLNCGNLIGSPVCGNRVKNMPGAYENCILLTGNPVCHNNIINMSRTYYRCTNLSGSPVCGENVTNMALTYSECANLTGSPVCGNNVVNMSSAYYNCGKLTGSAVCGNNVTDMSYAYCQCINLTRGACGPNVTNMYFTYSECINLTDGVIGCNVVDASSAYEDCSSLKNLDFFMNMNVYTDNGCGCSMPVYSNATNLNFHVPNDVVPSGQSDYFNMVNLALYSGRLCHTRYIEIINNLNINIYNCVGTFPTTYKTNVCDVDGINRYVTVHCYGRS